MNRCHHLWKPFALSAWSMALCTCPMMQHSSGWQMVPKAEIAVTSSPTRTASLSGLQVVYLPVSNCNMIRPRACTTAAPSSGGRRNLDAGRGEKPESCGIKSWSRRMLEAVSLCKHRHSCKCSPLDQPLIPTNTCLTNDMLVVTQCVGIASLLPATSVTCHGSLGATECKGMPLWILLTNTACQCQPASAAAFQVLISQVLMSRC